MRCSLIASVVVAVLTAASMVEARQVNVTNASELRQAISDAAGGDEIVLADGTYDLGTGKVLCGADGTAAAPIVVRAAHPLGAKIESASVEGFAVDGAHWHFEDLDVKGTCAADADCEHAFHVTSSGFVLRRSRIVDFNAQLKANATTGGARIPHQGLVEGCELFDTRPRDTVTPVTKLNIDTGDGWVVRANYIHDYARVDGEPVFAAFMKSGGKSGLFERNLVVCSTADTPPGASLGLSFGGGGTSPAYCAPAFDAKIPCDVEHEGGTMKNNIVTHCSDVGIYVNRAKSTTLLHNTLVATTGVDFRFPTASGSAQGNVVSGPIRIRDGASRSESNNLLNVTRESFEAMYAAPLTGDLRKKGDLSSILGKAPANAAVADDYCARTRSGSWDLGALQASLGDCATVLPPFGGGSSGGLDGGTSSSSGGTSGSSDGDASSGATSGGTFPSGAASPSGDEDDGCGVRATGRGDGIVFAVAVGVIVGVIARRRRSR